jgi:hypothetical protein
MTARAGARGWAMAEGHYRCYVPRDFRPEALAQIRQANIIIETYQARGFSLTLRQIYYQFVTKAWIENSDRSYARLGELLNQGRLAGLVSWTAIEDRSHSLHGHKTYAGPGEALAEIHRNYKMDLWATQPYRPEVWVEKMALAEVVGQICNKLRVDFFPAGGYVSQSLQWRAGRRMARYVSKGQRPIVFHLGDHDPSGLNMTEDNSKRLNLFAGVPVQVVRLALNFDQVERYRPPPNPAKLTDSRYAAYQREHGDESWELDALDPEVIQELISSAVGRLREPAAWDAALLQEAEDKRALEEITEELGEDPEAVDTDDC